MRQYGGLDYADKEDLIDHAAASDLVLINKSDLVPDTRVEEIDQLLDRCAPGVVRKVTAQASLTWADAIGTRSLSVDKIGGDLAHAAHTDFTSVLFENIPPLSERRLDALVELMKETCLRAKGFLQIDGQKEAVKRLQFVGQHVDLETVTAHEMAEPRLVVIGWASTLPIERVSSLLEVSPHSP